MRIGLDNIPPVTLGLFALNVFGFYNFLDWPLPPLQDVCIGAGEVLVSIRTLLRSSIQASRIE